LKGKDWRGLENVTATDQIKEDRKMLEISPNQEVTVRDG
jgi:hypothetical protein